jgi:hypothetical protein
MEPINEGNIVVNGNSYSYETYMPKTKKTTKQNGLWRMLRIRDIRGNEIVTIYNIVKDSLRSVIMTSLRSRMLS